MGKCPVCQKKLGFFGEAYSINIQGTDYCEACAAELIDRCSSCGKKEPIENNVMQTTLLDVKGKKYCRDCVQKNFGEEINRIPMTTTHNLDGHKVKRYIDVESVEIVIGTGIFSELTGEVSDFLGTRSTTFEKKLHTAKQTAFKKLKYEAFTKGEDALLGIDIDYTEFSGNRVGLIVNGTIVEVEAIGSSLSS